MASASPRVGAGRSASCSRASAASFAPARWHADALNAAESVRAFTVDRRGPTSRAAGLLASTVQASPGARLAELRQRGLAMLRRVLAARPRDVASIYGSRRKQISMPADEKPLTRPLDMAVHRRRRPYRSSLVERDRAGFRSPRFLRKGPFAPGLLNSPRAVWSGGIFAPAIGSFTRLFGNAE